MLNASVIIEDEEVQRGLRNLDNAIDNMAPAFKEIAGVLASEAEEAFEQEKDITTGKAWPDLAQSTKDQRAKKGKWPGKILQQSAGGLAASISQDSNREFAAAGSNKLYAAIHQFGGEAGRNHAVTIPARPYLGLSETGKLEIFDIISDHLEHALKT